MGCVHPHVSRYSSNAFSHRQAADPTVCPCSALITFVTFLLLSTNPTPDEAHRSRQLELWATFLGVSSALLAALRYAPQIAHTWGLKLVGALSIPMMCIQTPGAVLMVLSIALRPGTNWTSESPYPHVSLLFHVDVGTVLAAC